MIVLQNLTKIYNTSKIRSVDGLSVTVPDGSVLGLIGVNGSGKSTLLRMLAGIYRPTEGTLTVDGEPIFENAAKKAEIAYISDDQYYAVGATPLSTAETFARFYPNFSMQRFKELTDKFGINRNRRLSTFSKGMRRQCDVMIALAQCPRYMLLDECFDGLDPIIRDVARKEILANVADNGTTVIMSSHNLSGVESMCDSILLMNGGRLVLHKDLDDLKSNVCKYQMAFNTFPETEKITGINIRNLTVQGKFCTFLSANTPDEVRTALQTYSAETENELLYFEPIALSLDEVFAYELEERGMQSLINGGKNA